MRVAWSSLQDVKDKADEIRQAKEEGDRQVNEGTFRGSIAMTALQGKLERDFEHSLDIAWKSAAAAREIDPNAFSDIDGVELAPADVFAGVCSLRGDLRFALEKWDQAIALYQEALQHAPEDPGSYFNIGASYTNKHDAASAAAAFQKTINLNPTGRLGIEAAKNLERLKSGAIGRKGFDGSFKVVAVLGCLALISLLMIGREPGTGFMSFFFWGGILALYCWRKYK